MEIVKENFRIVDEKLGEHRKAIEFELRGAGQRIPIFFCSPDAVLEASNEVFLACALLPAMRSGMGLDLTGPLSTRFLNASPRILDIYTTWQRSLKRVSLSGFVPVDRTRTPSGRVGVFFSGGVDSFYSLLKHRDEITDLILVHGFEIPHDKEELFRRADASVQDVALEFGVGVTRVQTNLKTVLDTFVPFGELGHGLILFAIGHLLAPVVDRIYIPSTGSYSQLSPWGTSPVLDPLWSSEALEFVHDGCEANRPQKVACIAESDTALRYLRVCNERLGNKGLEAEYNCGRCEKCLRTMIALEVAGKLAQCRTFDGPLDARSIRRVYMWPNTRGYFVEILATLKEQGIRPDLQRALAQVLLRHTLREPLERLLRKPPLERLLRKPLEWLRKLRFLFKLARSP